METVLEKPVFIKINEIKPAVHCYNVYCTVISAKHSENTNFNGKTMKIVEGVVADETSCANYKFIGNHTEQMKVGKVIAIRNGKSSVVDEHILLELDQFGRVTEENGVSFRSVNRDKNISDAKWEKQIRNVN